MAKRLDFEGLETEVAGVNMRTPIGLGAVVERKYRGKRNAEEWADMIMKTVDAGAGMVTIATISYMPPEDRKELMGLVRVEKEEYREPAWRKPRPKIRMDQVIMSPHGFQALSMFEPGIRMDPERCGGEGMKKEVMAILKEKLPNDIPIIGSVTGYGSLPEGWLPCVKAAEEWGADLIELNASCPIPSGFAEYLNWYTAKEWPARYPGAGLLLRTHLFEKIIQDSAKAVRVPVGVKLSPELGFPQCAIFANQFKSAGAKFITTLNSATTICPPDIYNRGKPIVPHVSKNIICGANGPFLRLTNYKFVGTIANFVPGIDIIALGGIETPEHIVEFLMLGANAAEEVTAAMIQGRGLFRRQITFLKNFLRTQGYSSIKEIIGLHQQYLECSELITFEDVKYVAQTDPSLCTGCGICADIPVCMASYMENGVALVDAERCDGCGWCTYVCPQKARKLVRVK